MPPGRVPLLEGSVAFRPYSKSMIHPFHPVPVIVHNVYIYNVYIYIYLWTLWTPRAAVFTFPA